MQSIWRNYWVILMLGDEPFEAVKTAKDSLWYALRFFAVITLLASLGILVPIRGIVEAPTLAERITLLGENVEEAGRDLPRLLARPVESLAAKIEGLAAGVSEVQPPLGPRASKIVRLAGEWLSTPFLLLSAWMGWLLWVWFAARMLGGAGSLREHLSLSLLAVAPQILTFLNYTPQVESLTVLRNTLGLVATLWSTIILTQALAHAHSIDQGRALGVLAVSLVAALAVIALVGMAVTAILVALLV